ncbi:MAG TPA: signal peptidase II [Longimicrobium sp.]|nr:signal peptidase II [Longimicrobium sp.]
MKLSRNRWMALGILLVLAADWLTKFYVQTRVDHKFLPRPLLDEWLKLTYQLNEGISFGFLGEVPDGLRLPVVLALSALGIGATIAILRGSPRDRWLWVAGTLILGGALGNLGDRLLDGSVTDWIILRFFPWVFNVADIAITCGGVLLVLRMLRGEPRADDRPAPTFT